ncbi:MAG: BBP7 family outer membrane beta-barrel protein [Planctomycetales bacterium]|nr:BBP7 family outer membrane beta-barrel protein [Planctomycetales bacterium]
MNLAMSLTLAGLCLSQAYAGSPLSTAAASRSIGDASTDARPQNFQSTKRVSDQSISSASTLDNSILAPTTASYQGGSSAGSYVTESYHYEPGCYASTCGGCNSSNVWFSSETLLWFSKSPYSPTLVTTSDTGALPILGTGDTQSRFGGGDGIDFGLLPGSRISGGMYLGSAQKVAIGGRGYGIFSGSESFARTSDGSGTAANPSIGIPFFNAANNQDSALAIALPGGGGNRSGSVHARTDLDMIGGDGSLYLLLSRSQGHRIDLLGGYTYNHLINSISLDTTSTLGAVNTATHDLFETKNVFNGGHLGVLSSVVSNRVSLTTLAKVSFGNMRQSGSITGNNSETGAAAGFLTQPSNIGSFSRNTFAFLPELGIKLGYSARSNLQFTVGYTLLMWSGVGLAGDLIDTAVDPLQTVPVAYVGDRPEANFRESSFWMQGVDLGMTYSF